LFDFENPATYALATEGIDKVFLLGPPLRNDLDTLVLPFVHHLKSANVKRVVYIGALSLELVPELPFHTSVIEALAKEGFDYTVLKPSFFAQNFKNYEWENITHRGITFVPAGNGKVAFIDIEDIAAVAATVLTEEGHSAKTYQLTGPELFSYHDAAKLLTQITGKQIIYPQPSPEEYTKALEAAGAPDFIAPYMTAVYSLIADEKVAFISDDVEKITGKKPSSFKKVLEKDFITT